jgi:glycosyltransferase involved in cell wall biosynthesis
MQADPHHRIATTAAPPPRLRLGVALASYNGARYLGQQLQSLLAQRRRPDVLEVGDDGSTDASLELLEAFAAQAPFPVNITRNAQRLGYRENFLATAGRLNCDFIAFCDQDDVWSPDKLAAIEARLAAPAPAIDAAPLLLLIHGGAVTEADGTPRAERYPAIVADAVVGPLQLNLEQSYPGFSLCVHRSLLHRFDARYRAADPNEPGAAMAHDQWMVLLGAALGRVALLQKDLVLYRRHPQAATAAQGEPRSSLRRRLALALKTDASQYQRRAAYYADCAASLLRAAGADAGAADVQAAAAGLALRAAHCQGRAQIHAPGSSRMQRSRAMLRLLGANAYFGAGALGVSALIKDCAGTLLGTHRPGTGRREAVSRCPP